MQWSFSEAARATGFTVLTGLSVASGCGGKTTGEGTESSSGLEPGTPITTLSPAEQDQLCAWLVDQAGGPDARYECDTYVVRVDPTCELAFDHCSATVAEIEACAREWSSQVTACEPLGGPACDRVEATCDTSATGTLGGTGSGGEGGSGGNAGSTGSAGTGTGGVDKEPICVPGEQMACACTDGSQGYQSCSDGFAFGPCQCSPAPDCVPGQTRPCVCPDGRTGASYCSGGTFSQCECTSAGSCNPNFCPALDEATPCCASPSGPCGLDYGAGCETYRPR